MQLLCEIFEWELLYIENIVKTVSSVALKFSFSSDFSIFEFKRDFSKIKESYIHYPDLNY